VLVLNRVLAVYLHKLSAYRKFRIAECLLGYYEAPPNYIIQQEDDFWSIL